MVISAETGDDCAVGAHHAFASQFEGLLTMDDVFVPDHNGVRTLNVIDYLLGKCELD